MLIKKQKKHVLNKLYHLPIILNILENPNTLFLAEDLFCNDTQRLVNSYYIFICTKLNLACYH